MTLTEEEREELICILTLQTNYSEDYLSSITDEELLQFVKALEVRDGRN